MSKIEELIQKLCPNGVEYKDLEDVCNFRRGTTITAKNAVEGDVPVIAGGQTPAYYHNQSNREGETIVVAGSGAYAGYVSFWEVPIFVSDAFSVEPKSKDLIKKYVFYYLKNNQQKIFSTQKGSGVPHVHGSSIAKFSIPFPPVEVQEEIVRILDKFTTLSEKLNAELELRKKQYEYYRERLISSTRNCESIKLGDLCKIQRGVRVVKKQLEESGEYPVYQNSLEPLGFYDKSNYPANTSFIICGGAAGSIGFSNVDFWAADDCFCFISSDNLNDKYLFYVLKANQRYFDSRVRKAGVPRLSRNSIENFEMALPPLLEQERIVSILDKFDSLINDQEKGLPAEIRKVQQQYEYYRDKLLTF